jgi:hypothetical protein
VLQGIFYAAAFFKSSITGSILIMKLFIFAAECGSTLLFVKLLKHYKMPSKNVLLFVLNPLVIIELSGNIHFEGIMLFFLLFSIWLLITQKTFLSSVMFSLAICTKLLPLMFLPLVIKAMGIRKGSIYCFAVVLLSAIMWMPFLNIEFAGHLFSSIGLYFHNFEFNAGIYYLARWIGFKFSGYNLIAFCGPVLSIISFLSIIILSFRQHKIRNDFNVILLILSIYFLLSTTVHPWYITSLVGFSVLTNFRYAIAWSFLVCVSYSAYQTTQYQENLLFTGIEYIIVFSWAAIELFTKRKKEKDSVVYIFEK